MNSSQNDAQIRHVRSLDGAWNFIHQSDGSARTATVPMPWQAQFSDLRQVSGKAVYQRHFEAPAISHDQELVIKFGAVSYYCEVFCNDLLLGSHEGGYLPFELPVPADVLTAQNTLTVNVTLPTGDRKLYPEFPFAEIPHGKQSWYGPIGGIWQSVMLEVRNKKHVRHCAITADRMAKTAGFDLKFSAAAIGTAVTITIHAPSGDIVTRRKFDVTSDQMSQSLVLDSVLNWSPDSPNLYTATMELSDTETTLDSTSHTFGFRSFETQGGKFYLNGEPYHMRGALDQDYYPEGICTPPSIEFLEDQLRKAKHLGLNMLRCHIKVPDPRYYEVADRLGILIWTEIPNVATFTPKSAQRMRDTMEGIIERDFNHPCIVIWTIINEDWGTRLMEDASHRDWLKQTYDWLKALDPTRLVVDNSPCHTNFHVKTDINDYHYYRSVPERRAEWDALTQEFATKAAWTFSPHGDGEWRGDEPLVVSEFGVWGLPHVNKLIEQSGKEPWWMETGPGWGDGAAYPHGVQNRFETYQLGSVFGSFDAFIDAVQWYQFRNLKYQIESMRAWPSIQGYIITELTDVHWEANGLLDINRNTRVFHDQFATINTDVVIVPQITFYAVSAGKTFSCEIKIATGGKAIQAGAVLHWSLGELASDSMKVPQTASLEAIDAGTIEVNIPAHHKGGIETLTLSLTADGAVISANSESISVYAKRRNASAQTVTANDPNLAAFAEGLGYKVGPKTDAAIRLVHALDANDISDLQAGARYIVLADGSVKTHGNLRTDQQAREQPFIAIVDETPGNLPNAESHLPNIALIARQGTMWRGDWIASFSWIRRSAAFAAMPGGPLLDLSFDRVAPRYVMTGFRPWEYDSAVHAGLVVGWAHKPAVLIGERRVGQGMLIATTFCLTNDAAGVDPVASALFDALIEAVAEANL